MHAQVGSIIDGILRRALLAGFDAGRRSAEGTSGDLRKGKVVLARETREVGLGTHHVALRKRKKLPLLRNGLVLLNEVRDARQGNRDIRGNESIRVQGGHCETLGEIEEG
jgi:hypothetical protein